LPAESIRKRSGTQSGEARDPSDAVEKLTTELVARERSLAERQKEEKSIASQKAAKYFAEQEARLGPIAPKGTEDYRLTHIAGAVASFRAARARLVSNGIQDFTAEIDALIARMAKAAGMPAAA
jgi:hypothetical protein